MPEPTTRIVESDVLIIGGGMSGCGAAIEARYWGGDDLRIVMVDKAATDRSGAVGEGLSAINMYMGMRHGWNQPEDYVEYVRNDMMGVSREDLVYDVARHVDSSVHMFEEWGLPFWYDDEGLYVREGRWQVMIHGEAYKPIVAEATKKAIGPDNHFERVFISHLFTDADDPRPHCRRCRIRRARGRHLHFQGAFRHQRGRRRYGDFPAPQRGRGHGPHLVLHL